MNHDPSAPRGVLYVVSCASSAAERVPEVVTLAQAAGWHVCVITTPQGIQFIEVAKLERLTGHPVRSEYKRPEDPDILPRADAILVFPATFNTLNKWALGITDTLALGILCEYLGLRMPIVAVPGIHTGSGLDTHPALSKSIDFLRTYGVQMLYEPESYPPNNKVPANKMLDALNEKVRAGGSSSLLKNR